LRCGFLAAGLLDHAADAPGLALHRLALHDLADLLDLALILDALDVLALFSRRFGDVNRAAANERTARRTGGQFRKGHPNRHKRCSLLNHSLRVRPACLRQSHETRVPPKTQRVVNPATGLTVLGASQTEIFRRFEGLRGKVCRYGTD
jgi:hypothetical protein